MISIFMPAYGVEKELADTVRRIPAACWDNVTVLFIIDDGSPDSTWKEIEGLSRENAKIVGIQSKCNEGYGETVKKGMALCLETSCDYVVCLHGDGQYAPELLPEMIAFATANALDILQGSRLANSGALSGGMPLYKYIAGKLLVFLENSVFHLRMTDYHSGYLIYSRKFLQQSDFATRQSRFEIDLEMIATAKARCFRIGEFPIPTRYAGEQSHLNPIGYGFKVLGVLGRYILGKYAR